uniref:hypothetical protein n=1 Tax=unclassified Arthrobacter TaxID=235627 RepID=UPI001566A449|nr:MULTISPECIES: hypothetical protein [unclassified Arthrobacter]
MYAAVYGRPVTDGRSKKSGWISFGLPDDRKSYWAYLVAVGLVAVALVNLVDDPASDTKVQVLTVLALALTSMVICFYWAFSLQRASVSVADYIKGTTASRTMLWFWAVFGSISAVAPLIGIGGQSFVPLWESALGAFAGIGSVLLTAGPAYKEYREAMATVVAAPEPRAGWEPLNDPRTVAEPSNGGRYRSSIRLLLVSLVAVFVIGRRSGRSGR